MEPYYQDDLVTLYLGDCRNQIEAIPSTAVLVTDPPYGIDYRTDDGKHVAPNQHAAIKDDHVPFDPSHLRRFERAVIFGGNNFAESLPNSGAWIVWDKVIQNDLKVRIAEAELAWTNCLTRTRVYRHLWSGAFRASERNTSWHPTQKPVALMQWILQTIGAKPTDTIFDPYAGSGSTLRAAKNLGISSIGIEYEERYCERIVKRLAQQAFDFGDWDGAA